MIIINLIGGLGNQMFQYAMARALSLEKKHKLRLNVEAFDTYLVHKFGLHNFNIALKFYKIPSRYKSKFNKKFKKTVHYVDEKFYYNPEIKTIKCDFLFLDGYFQTEKYFKKYENEIRNDFKITGPLKEITKEFLKKIESQNSVSIHIRRGDYLLTEIHNTDKKEFYDEALKYIITKVHNPHYYIFSNDMEWVKENFKTNSETTYIDFNDADSNYEDMKLMSTCKHNIIANSSFSWWSAWLNTNLDKIIIAPKIWFNGETYNYVDLVPDNWIKF
jgi:hypothetical protein